METPIMAYIGNRIWGLCGYGYNLPKAIFDLLKRDYHRV